MKTSASISHFLLYTFLIIMHNIFATIKDHLLTEALTEWFKSELQNGLLLYESQQCPWLPKLKAELKAKNWVPNIWRKYGVVWFAWEGNCSRISYLFLLKWIYFQMWMVKGCIMLKSKTEYGMFFAATLPGLHWFWALTVATYQKCKQHIVLCHSTGDFCFQWSGQLKEIWLHRTFSIFPLLKQQQG